MDRKREDYVLAMACLFGEKRQAGMLPAVAAVVLREEHPVP
ncbi:hypothetical protein [uncultured Alistipes sp.]|nr:hypothetical protein [uncultured Alistipes sp.]